MRRSILFCLTLFFCYHLSAQTYNKLWIPDTLTGTNFTLTAKDTFKQMLPGNQTITASFNNNDWWGPTLIWNKGTTVNLTVNNKLQDSVTVHWHGMHLPAIMDGGPHQIVPPHTIWQPYFTVTNNAGFFWFHPHMNMEASKQISSGLGGLIIIRDSQEAALKLPRTYAVDDIPLILSDRRFDNTNQIVSTASYGDTMVTNGILNAETHLPAQVVRIRILNASLERAYNLGFSDNRTFYVVATDGGLVNKPVAVTRFIISDAERVEILVDLSKDKNSTLDLRAYNASLPRGISGFEPSNFPGPLANKLGARDFNILHINVDTQNANAITVIPSAMVNNVFWDTSNVAITRKIFIADTNIVGKPPVFTLNHKTSFNFNNIDFTVGKGHYEIWEINNTSVIAHPFHIHDIEFHILSRNGSAAPNYEQGWKDVVLVKQNETVRFIGKFDDFSDSIHPYMYHCHIAPHEDGGLMGQFVVSTISTGIATENYPKASYSLYPNPANDKLMLKFENSPVNIYYITITDLMGRTYFMLPKPRTEEGMDISSLKPGTYFLNLTDDRDKKTYSKMFVKE